MVSLRPKASRPLPPEFDLVAACCRWPPSEDRNTAIRSAAQAQIDWDRLVRVTDRHRVWGLVHDGLGQARIDPPQPAQTRLAEAAANAARQSFELAVEAARLQGLFDDAGVSAAFVKGSALGVLAYGAIGIKHARDIDILIPPQAVRQAMAVLQGAGYRPRQATPSSPALFGRWMQAARDLEFFNPRRKSVVELHWALTANAHHAARLTAHLRTRRVEVGGGASLQTLQSPVLFVYLCMHGALHGWSRLKWLADAAALMSRFSADEFEQCLDLARACDIEPCVAQAVLLCDRLFDSSISRQAAALYRRVPRYRWLERMALKVMTRANAEVEVADIPFGALPIFFTEFALGRRWGYLLGEVRRRVISARDMVAIPLPRPLWFLYPILRPVLSVRRRLRSRAWLRRLLRY